MDTFTKQKIEEFEKVMDKGFIDYFGSHTGGFVPKHYKERFKSFLTLALTEYKKQSSCCIHCVNKTSLKEELRKWAEEQARGACCDCKPEEGYKCYHAGREEQRQDLLSFIKGLEIQK